ncbi:nitrate- and nitrite sensing domain-containing protein [Actinacidiphila acidipaludis]|uniref:histidine kinase n=1 Tax=Actinacidiphila acidipaludis TaxID=2873382 RepID=A0ABS7QFB3_9ACTN|nr:nitrate- and nitrite sensing domain-containing protein [Streptomyces acidipaludis]MBY8881860.1 nitrate- and nitrite sensing domain-containing protein [Streptomyces acidipaludis]
MQGRFKRDSGAAGDPEQQPGGTASGSTQAAADSGSATPGTAAAPGRNSTPSGIEAGRITGLEGKPGPRIAMRNWRISTRLVSLLALPVVTAGALGGLSIKSSLDNINQLEHMKTLTDITEHATDLAAALQEERDSSAGPLESGQTNNDAIAASRETTDREYTLYKNASDNVQATDSVYKGVRATLLSIGTQLSNLNQIRDQAYTAQSGIAQTVSQYDGLIQSLLSLSQDMAQATNNHEMIQATRALAAFSAAKEYESIQRAVISAAFATGGTLSANDYQTVYWSHDDEKLELNRFQAIYGEAPSRELLMPIYGGNDTITSHDSVLNRIYQSPDGIKRVPMSYPDWDDAAKTKIQAMNQIERSLLNEMQQRALKLQSEAKQSALISGAIILLVLGVAVVGAFVVARSMIRSLRRLQQTAQDVAQKRLPELVKQLSESDPQDVDTSVESIGINSRDEIGQVARAFDEVHSEAVRLAAEQALLRGNVNAMFTNLSRRSQGLIQRQLSLISELESREADPDQLSSLFKLDHLATRMRRNGENLLVLAGEEPGRRWTRPVPLVDVLRAAASEVEQYERIELTSVPSAEVTGRIVNDLVHLLAELLENATSFSSPQTKVRVTGHSLPDGRVLIEIHDTGIGLSPEDLADINERLANPPTVDVSVSRRMGLFVVGRLSLRHGIRIQLRPSDSGGTTALVMLPVDVTQGGANQKNTPAGARPAAAPPAQGGTGIAGAFGNTPRVGAGQQRGQVAGGAQRPAIGTGGGRPGPQQNGPQQNGPQQNGPRWAAQDGPQGGFPEDRGQDTPRGHEEVEAASAFDGFESGPGRRDDFPQTGRDGDLFGGRQDQQPGRPGPGGPGAQQPGRPGQPNANGMGGRQGGPQGGGFPPPQPQSTGPGGFRSDVFGGRPGPTPRQGGQGGPGDTGQFPAHTPQGGPGDTAQFPPVRDDDFAPTGQTGQFPAQGGPRGPQSPQGPRGGWAPNGQDRGVQDPYGTGQFPVQGGPGDTGQFPVQGGPGDTGQYPVHNPQGRPGDTGQYPVHNPQGGPGDTGQFPVQGGPGDTGQYPVHNPQGGPGDTAQIPVVRGEDLGDFRAPQGGLPGGLPQRGPRGPQGTPGWTPNGQEQGGQDQYGTGSHRMPDLGSQGTGQYPVQQQPVQQQHQAIGQQPVPPRPAAGRPEQQLPPAAEPMALPPAPTRGDEPTPIFSSIESDWFRTGQAERMQQIHVEPGLQGAQGGHGVRGQQAPMRPVGRTAPPQRPAPANRPAGPGAQRPTGPQPSVQTPPAPVAQPLPRETPNWRSSPNDALRQRAEQVREPSAGGVTPAGLPRRVPRANLVAGGAAQQQAPTDGPQVSRSPDDVRGRLTNLRRGIQQGRQAGGGTDGRGFGTNHQER